MTGFVKEIHGGSHDQFSKKVPVLSMNSLRALVFCIRNCFEADVMQGQKAFPEALSDSVSTPKMRYTFTWKLDTDRDFQKLHKVLIPLNAHKTQFEYELKKDRRIESVDKERKQKLESTSVIRIKKEANADLMLELLPPPKEKSLLAQPELKDMKPKISLQNKILYKLEMAKKTQQSKVSEIKADKNKAEEV